MWAQDSQVVPLVCGAAPISAAVKGVLLPPDIPLRQVLWSWRANTRQPHSFTAALASQ